MIQPKFPVAFPIVDQGGRMTPAFRDFMLQLGFLLPITGTGSPEGVIEAPQYSVYLDTTGTTGTIQYRKMEKQIGGDPTQGWVLV